MCGICGMIDLSSKPIASLSLIKKMADALTHRGPDDEGFFVKQGVALGHRRLSIIDLFSGHQPIFNENKNICIVFNGEIYNYKDLFNDLVQKGHRFLTHSDTEVIVHLYEEYGPECVNKLRGMFVFALWDEPRKRLMVARDRLGKKPLYYYRGNDVFLFASEIKAMLKSGLVRAQVNESLFDFYLSLGYTPGAETFFKDISKLEPGNYLLLEEHGSLNVRQYWDIVNVPARDISFQEAFTTIKKILLESVSLRLMSEVPLGVFLSGGLDSSAIVALMSEVSDKRIKTFSVGYKDAPQMSELKYARVVSDKFKTDHQEFFLTHDDLFSSIDTLLEHTEEPLVESAGIALYKLSKLAKPHATVLLSGEGSDEIFAGYALYEKMHRIENIYGALRFIPGFIRNQAPRIAPTEKLNKYLEWICMPFEERYRSVSFDLTRMTREKMYTRRFRESLDGKMEGYFNKLHSLVQGKSLLGKMLYIDTKTWLAEDILTKSDRMTMAASIEMRCPFLDHTLVEFCAGLPDEFKLRNGTGKFILKEIMKELLPEEIVFRKKMGFPVPLTGWFRGGLYEKAKQLLLEEKSLSRGYFNSEYVRGLFTNIQKKHDLGKRIFSLVTLELWHRKYID
ncbi:MAG: asparagine synthase (glutamine-hydrolyzing) [Candidatus Omnitrophota bacterium]